MKTLLRLLLVPAVLIAASATRAADKPAAPAPTPAPAPAAVTASVTGTWNLQVETGQGTGTPVFTFKQDGEKLTGRYKGAFGEADVTGSLKGADIKFSFKVNPQGQELECVYTATVEGDSMKGKVQFGSLGEGTFTGKRQPAEKPKGSG